VADLPSFPFPVAASRPKAAAGVALATAALLAATLAGCSASSTAPPAGGASKPTSVLGTQTPGEALYELSPVRVQVRRLSPQAMRLLAPHWSSVRESDRRVLQATLAMTLSPDRVTPFVRGKLDQAVSERPDLAAAALEWLRSPVGYEVKFAEATAWHDDKSADDSFYRDVAEVKAERTPEIRMDRIRRLADATGALAKAIDLTDDVGTVVARLVNVARPGRKPLALADLAAVVKRERSVPDVVEAYGPVVRASLLARCRGLDLQDLDRYIEFASSDAGRWYHDTLAAAVAYGVEQAAMDVEGVFDTNAHSDAPLPAITGFDLDSLVVDLGAGRSVRLLALAQTGPENDPAVLLRYETELPMRDAAAVRAEAGLVWDKLRGQVQSEGARAAVLQATGSVEGWVFPFASSRKFAWRRAGDGDWAPLTKAPGSFGDLEREMLWSVPP
jgi:hypothetical protein